MENVEFFKIHLTRFALLNNKHITILNSISVGHWLLHAFGIISIAQERDYNLYLPMLGLVPVPGTPLSTGRDGRHSQ